MKENYRNLAEYYAYRTEQGTPKNKLVMEVAVKVGVCYKTAWSYLNMTSRPKNSLIIKKLASMTGLSETNLFKTF